MQHQIKINGVAYPVDPPTGTPRLILRGSLSEHSFNVALRGAAALAICTVHGLFPPLAVGSDGKKRTAYQGIDVLAPAVLDRLQALGATDAEIEAACALGFRLVWPPVEEPADAVGFSEAPAGG